MNEGRVYEAFTPAYVAALHALIKGGDWVEPTRDPYSVGSRFGTQLQPTRELRGVMFTIADPTKCLLVSEPRQPSLPFVFGQWIWVMAGSRQLEPIAYYNSRG